jgi:hypothetical protein
VTKIGRHKLRMANWSDVYPRDPGSNLGTERKIVSYSVSVAFEFKSVGC